MNVLDLPFNQHVGLHLERHGGRQVVCLDPDERHANHLGTVHASAVFSLAEAASGHALLERCSSNPKDVVAVLRSASVKYRRPAAGRLYALASLEASVISGLSEQLGVKGRALIDVSVRVQTVNNEEVFAGTFSWFVSRAAQS